MSEIQAITTVPATSVVVQINKRLKTESLRAVDHLVLNQFQTIYGRFADRQACNPNHRDRRALAAHVRSAGRHYFNRYD
jgi:hypothetical protein